MTDLRQSKDYAQYLKLSGWKVEKVNTTYIFLRKFPIIGWFVKIQRPEVLSGATINLIENKYKPFQFSIEPLSIKQTKQLTDHNFKLSNSPSLPTKTLVMDITKSEKELLKNMSSKARYNITRASSLKRVVIEKCTNISEFANLKGNFLSQKKNIIKLHRAFGKKAHLFCAYENNKQSLPLRGKLLAGILLLTTKDTAYYMHAASTKEGNKLFAPTLLTWHTIQFAKKKGFKTYDFDGIYDDRFPIKSWQGFTKFKKSFGGKEIEYPGNFVKNKIGNIIKL